MHAQANPAVVGQWSPILPFIYEPVHVMLLPTGKVLYWSWAESLYPQIWDPVSKTTTPAATAPYLVFCAGHSAMADGKLFVAGGHIADRVGLAHASIYDPFSDTWTQLPDMNTGRWYPTNTALPNGDVLVTAGNIDNIIGANTLPQIWQVATGTWRDLSGAEEILPMYPRMHVAPNGQLFMSGANRNTSYLDPAGTGTWITVANTNTGYRDYGASVMYDLGRVVLIGGGDPPTATTEVINLSAPSPSWQVVASMSFPRRHVNATLLPDGKIVATGGSSGSGFDDKANAVHAAEIWDSATNTWTVMAANSSTIYRGYHSNAILLPDGSVLTLGGDEAGATAEIFSPPYLFKGARPTITSAPPSIAYGQTFPIDTPDFASITNISLIRLGSATHAFDQDQRILKLTFAQTASGLSATAPANGNVAPPGYYMLFILNTAGVPSVSKMVRLGTAADPVPSAPNNVTATVASDTQINLAWIDTSNNETGFKIERSPDGLSFSEIATTAANTTSYADQPVTPGTQYYYRVRSFNTNGNSNYSAIINATTSGASIAAPTGLTATAGTGPQVQLTWTDNSTTETGFRVERSTDNVAFGQIASTNANITTYTDTTVAGSMVYYYRIRAYTASSNSTYSNTATVTTSSTIPTAPSGLTAVAVSATQIDLSWTNASSTNLLNYEIERSSNGVSFSQIATPPSSPTVYSDRTVFAGATFYYRVRAHGAAGNSSYSAIASATTPAGVPAAPSGLTALVWSSTEIRLSWMDNSTNETGFKVENSRDGITFTPAGIVGADITAFPNTGLNSVTTYYFRVVAYNGSGNSAYSPTISATTDGGIPAPPGPLLATAIGRRRIDLQWSDNSGNEGGFRVYRSLDGVTYTQIANVSYNTTSYSNTRLTTGTKYYYKVLSFNSAGSSQFSAPASDTAK